MKFKLLLLLANAGAMYFVYIHDRPDRTLLGLSILFCTYIYQVFILQTTEKRKEEITSWKPL